VRLDYSAIFDLKPHGEVVRVSAA